MHIFHSFFNLLICNHYHCNIHLTWDWSLLVCEREFTSSWSLARSLRSGWGDVPLLPPGGEPPHPVLRLSRLMESMSRKRSVMSAAGTSRRLSHVEFSPSPIYRTLNTSLLTWGGIISAYMYLNKLILYITFKKRWLFMDISIKRRQYIAEILRKNTK